MTAPTKQELIDYVHAQFGDAKRFCARLRKRMAAIGATQSDLAKELGAAPSHVWTWYHYDGEKGAAPQMETMVRLEEALLRLEKDHAENQQLGLDL